MNVKSFEIQNHLSLSALVTAFMACKECIIHCLTDANKEDRAGAVRVRFCHWASKDFCKICSVNSCSYAMLSVTHLDFDNRKY